VPVFPSSPTRTFPHLGPHYPFPCPYIRQAHPGACPRFSPPPSKSTPLRRPAIPGHPLQPLAKRSHHRNPASSLTLNKAHGINLSIGILLRALLRLRWTWLLNTLCKDTREATGKARMRDTSGVQPLLPPAPARPPPAPALQHQSASDDDHCLPGHQDPTLALADLHRKVPSPLAALPRLERCFAQPRRPEWRQQRVRTASHMVLRDPHPWGEEARQKVIARPFSCVAQRAGIEIRGRNSQNRSERKEARGTGPRPLSLVKDLSMARRRTERTELTCAHCHDHAS
jgi:hypothetical protein